MANVFGRHLKSFLRSYPKYRSAIEPLFSKSKCKKCGDLNDSGRLAAYNLFKSSPSMAQDLKAHLRSGELTFFLRRPGDTARRLYKV